MMPRILILLIPLLLPGLIALTSPLSLHGQSGAAGGLTVVAEGQSPRSIPILRDHGVAALPLDALTVLGWASSVEEGELRATLAGEHELRLRSGSPFVTIGGELFQLAAAPWGSGDAIRLPLQLVVDLLPEALPSLYAYDAATRTLTVRSRSASSASLRDEPVPSPVETPLPRPSPVRVVVIDPGHGGEDPGARGVGGSREKDIALAIGLALARELRGDPTLEVYLTRDSDTFVPLWERGPAATRWKGDRPGVFISLHANALPSASTSRGFETYFLSEARTEHERRVAAIENAPLSMGRGAADEAIDPGLSSILRELRALDHQHWSALLAQMVQDELGRFHPGPNRGVKQGPFAVITNSLMPSVLVEVGFMTHREEERLMMTPAFQRDAAVGIANAVRAFFERYPPGQSVSTRDQP